MRKILYVAVIVVFLISILTFALQQKGEVVVSLSGLLVALLALPYFTFDIELRKHKQQLLFEERLREIRRLLASLYNVSLPLYDMLRLYGKNSTSTNSDNFDFQKELLQKASIELDALQENMYFYRMLFPQNIIKAITLCSEHRRDIIHALKKVVGTDKKVPENLIDQCEELYADLLNAIGQMFKGTYYDK